MDKVIGVVETRSQLPKILERVANGERFIIAQRSRARAVLLSPEEVETLEVMADKKLLKELVEAKEDIKTGRYQTFEKFFKEPRGR
jgi:antitoxin (DNA-binding transcriptional repressor) of toxin-antitoxin stability system